MNGKIIFGSLDIGNDLDINQRTIDKFEKSEFVVVEDPEVINKINKKINKKNNKKILIWPSDDDTILDQILQHIEYGKDVLYLSGEGMPGVTDPGTLLARFAIDNNIKYTAIPGPSILSLMPIMSGLCCEGFIFERLIPIDQNQRISLFKSISLLNKPILSLIMIQDLSAKSHTLEVLDDILSIFSENCDISIGINLTSKNEIIITDNIRQIILKVDSINFPAVSKIAIFIVPESRLNHNCL
jgi:16S rRNA (cytidine1402-2'-O)-methyltransferase